MDCREGVDSPLCKPRHRIERPTLAEILAPNPLSRQLLFWITVTVALALVHGTLYLFRTVYLIACVEDIKTKPREDLAEITNGNLFEQEWLVSIQPGQHGHSATGALSLDSSTHGPRSNIPSFRSDLFSWVATASRSLNASFCYPQEEHGMISRNLQTSVRQLRYFSGQSLFALRAAIPFIVYYHVVPWILRLLCTMVPFGTLWIRNVNNKSYGWTHNWEYWLIGIEKAITPVVLQHLWMFHTLRVLSTSTGFTTNFAEEYIFDRGLFKRKHWYARENGQIKTWFREIIQRDDLLLHLAYGFADALSAPLPAMMAKPIRIADRYYSLDGEKRKYNFLLSNPERRFEIFKVMAVWICLQGFRMTASSFMYRRHAEYMSPKQRTIIFYQRNKPRSLRALNRARILRLSRISLQMILAGGLVGAVVALLASLCIHTLDNGDLLSDWLARAYFEFDTSASCLGSIWSASFWFIQLTQTPLNPVQRYFKRALFPWKRQPWLDLKDRPHVML